MKILLTYLDLSTFVSKDIEILKIKHDVRPFQFRGLQDLLPLWKAVLWSDLTISWFGTIHAFFSVMFSKMLKKKSVVISGGYDVARTPLLPYYGALNRPIEHGGPIKRWGVYYTYANSDLILSVSEFNKLETIVNARAKSYKIRVVHHGFDYNIFKPLDGSVKNGTILTVGRIDQVSSIRKGLDIFVQSARFLPENKFILVGIYDQATLAYLKSMASSNVVFRGYLNNKELIQTFSEASVYVQVSRHEAFGCSVAEAMLFECVPVISRNGSLPEVVGDCGIYVDSLDPKLVAGGIKSALSSGLGLKARRRIRYKFPIEKRKYKISNSIDNLFD